MKKIFKLSMLFCILSLSAQRVQVKGVIVDAAKNPLTNVGIFVKDAKDKGTVSDYDGSYSIFVEKGDSLIFKIVGFKDKTIKIRNQKTLNVTLQAETKQLSEVSVSGHLNRNLGFISSNRLPIKSIDMPTSTTRIDASLIQEQMILKPSEVFMNVAGVYQFNQGYGGSGETIGARGISLRYQGYMFRDGLRMGANQSGATPEMQIFEAVEVHKGASAINFGYTSIGAVINYVTKKPTFKTEGSITMRAAQYSFYKPSLDMNVKINDKFGLRFIGSYENSGSFRETLKSQRAFGYLAGKLLINNRSSLSFNVDYLYDKTPRDFGLPIYETSVQTGTTPQDGKDVPVYKQTTGVQKHWSNLDRTRFIGSPFNQRITNQFNTNAIYALNLLDEAGILKDWKGTLTAGMSQSSNTYQQTGSGFRNKYKLLDNNDIEITRSFEKGRSDDRFLSAIGNLTGKIAFSKDIVNTVSLNMDYDGRTNTYYRYNTISNFDKITLKSSEGQKENAPELSHTYKSITNTYGAGASWQNLVSFYDTFNVLLSLRYDYLKVITPEYTYEKDYRDKKAGDTQPYSFYEGRAWSTSLGVVYKFTSTASLYASHLSGFELNRRAYKDKNGELLPGYNQYQWEVGVKQSWYNQKLNLNFGYYNIGTKSYNDINGNGNVYEIGNGVTYKGYELETSIVPLEGLLLGVNYTYIDAKYVKGGSRKQGTRQQQTPEHQLGFNISKEFIQGTLKGLSLVFNGQYTGERLGNDVFVNKKTGEDRYTYQPYIQDAQTLLSAGASYILNNWKFATKVSNLSDILVYNSYRYGSMNPVAPRTFTLSATYNF